MAAPLLLEGENPAWRAGLADPCHGLRHDSLFLINFLRNLQLRFPHHLAPVKIDSTNNVALNRKIIAVKVLDYLRPHP